MKILQVVTLISPDGAYGGPVRVSFNQARQLLSLGHEVSVAGAGRGHDPSSDELEGIPVSLTKPRQLFPFVGFAGLSSPGLLMSMLRRRASYDVVHVHLARDFVTLPAALLALLLGKRLLVQTHGMIIKSSRFTAPIMDRLLTRPVLRRAEAVFYLSEAEKRGLLEVEPQLALVHLPNGVPVYEVVANSDIGHVDVLYLARLHARKRPKLFVEVAAELLAEGVDARFQLVGPDGGEASSVTDTIERSGDARITYEGPLQPTMTVERMMHASVYVLPSIDEPFPMSVLEAMSVGLPVVITDTCGLAEVVSETGSGIVVNDGKQELKAALRELIQDPVRRRQMGAAARSTAAEIFSMEAVGRTLVSAYGRGTVPGPSNSG